MKTLGVITARGGSKGIPGKNIKNLLGKPLIAYTIEAANKSGALDKIIVSTDDNEIAKVAKEYGAEVPFVRPAELSQDTTPHLPVLQHALEWLRDNEDYWPDYTIILSPTAPLRQPFHIKEAVELAEKSKPDSVLSVAKIHEHFSPQKAMTINDNGFLRLSEDRPIYKRIPRRQDLAHTYWSVASIYLFKTELLFDKAEPNFYGEKTLPYIMEEKYVVDIDEPEDWVIAEEAMRNLKS